MKPTLPKKPSRSQLKKRLCKLLVARNDFKATIRTCDIILKTVKTVDDTIYYPLFTAAIICYARPFTDNKPFGKLPKIYEKFDNKKHQEGHGKIIKARNEIVAHSDMRIKNFQIIPPNTVVEKDKNGKPRKNEEIITRVNYHFFPLAAIKEIREMTFIQILKTGNEINELLDKLYLNRKLPKKVFDITIDNGL